MRFVILAPGTAVVRLSGQLTSSQQRRLRLKPIWASLLFAGIGEAMGFPISRLSLSPDPSVHIVALAFGPVTGLMAFALLWWFNRDCVVEFSCDDTSFRFRKQGAAETETRRVGDIVKVERMGRYDTSGYCIGFRDGAEACVSVRIMPDGPELGEWFRTHLGKAPAESSAPPLSQP